MKQDNEKFEDDEVEIHHRINHIKRKVVKNPNGSGFIPPKTVKRAQDVIQNSEETYLEEAENTLKHLETIWYSLQETPEDKKDHLRNELSRYANRTKDMASTYGHELMDYFACSLRDFSDKIEFDNPAHHTIVQAHINVMWVVFKEQIKDHSEEKAVQLKEIVAQAIKKHS